MAFYIKKRINYEKSCIGTVYKTDAFKKQASIVIQELNREVKVVEQTGEE
ncbi:hypothetical protein [Clostridium sp. 001]|nr:hypothetical protein [Clostridium sp. 001]